MTGPLVLIRQLFWSHVFYFNIHHIFLFIWRTFPKCKFADKCLFIHPPCKFDGRLVTKRLSHDLTYLIFECFEHNSFIQVPLEMSLIWLCYYSLHCSHFYTVVFIIDHSRVRVSLIVDWHVTFQPLNDNWNLTWLWKILHSRFFTRPKKLIKFRLSS